MFEVGWSEYLVIFGLALVLMMVLQMPFASLGLYYIFLVVRESPATSVKRNVCRPAAKVSERSCRTIAYPGTDAAGGTSAPGRGR